jgi:hypothetical protein
MPELDKSHQPPVLPGYLTPFFWDCDWQEISWEKNADFITRRILQAGDWRSISWLRGLLGDQALRRWLESHRGGGLAPRQLRFWGLVLSIPPGTVTRWIHKTQAFPWETRLTR